MKHRGSALLAVLALTAPALADERALVLAATQPSIDASIAGKPVRLRVDPAAGSSIELDRSVVRRLGLLKLQRVLESLAGTRESGESVYQIGRVRLRGGWSSEQLMIAGRKSSVRVGWTERDEDDAADGVIAPALLPYDEVRLVQHVPAEGERAIVLPVHIDKQRGVLASVPVGVRAVDVEFAPFRSRTVATAAAGSFIGAARGGRFEGPEEMVLLTYRVSRPARRLELAKPVTIAGFALRELLVRTDDWRGTNLMPADGTAPEDEILVTGNKERQREWAKITLGADLLRQCSSIGYRRDPAAIVLTCPGAPRRSPSLCADGYALPRSGRRWGF